MNWNSILPYHHGIWNLRQFLLVLLLASVTGCSTSSDVAESGPGGAQNDVALVSRDDSIGTASSPRRRRVSKHLQRLSEYQLFRGDLADLVPSAGVVPYDVNTPLFTDYAGKHRVIRLPEGASAPYNASKVFDFPVGTVIAKTFYYDRDMTDPARGRRLIETRILLHDPTGWIGLPYVWNEQQSDATLSLTGGAADVQWVHFDGNPRENRHLIPNFNDCKRCHENSKNEPIGPTARNINRDFQYDDGSENQLDRWSRVGLISGAPPSDQAPRLAAWNAPETGSLDHRARAWLEVNCAHCHSPIGPARNSGLHLHADVTNLYRLGIFKTPVAAGRGTGGRLYDIVPGKPDESILMHRLETDHAGEMMPELGRSLVHVEGAELIRDWIESLPPES